MHLLLSAGEFEILELIELRWVFLARRSQNINIVNGPGSEPGKPVDRRGTVGEKVY